MLRRSLTLLSREVSSSTTSTSLLRTPLASRSFHSSHVTRNAASLPNGGGMPSIPPPLQGIKVVDLTRVLAGPYCTMLLADLGADVIKVEHPKGGDDTRAWSPPSAPLKPIGEQRVPKGKEDYWASLPAESAYFLSVNRNKRSITVDLKTEKGKNIVRELVKKADVVVENYLPGKLASMSLGYEDLKAINPSLIYASITGYGQTGPYSSAAGYDVIIAADAGLFHMWVNAAGIEQTVEMLTSTNVIDLGSTGEADRPPVKIGVAMTDLTTGLYVHGAVMAALIGRAKTGKGVHIDASLFESQIASLANIASSYLVAGKEATRWGTAHPSIVPYQVFATKDGFMMIGAGNDRQFSLVSQVLGRPEMAQDPDYSTNAARVANRTRLIEILQSLFTNKTTQEWIDALGGKVPAAPIRDIKGTFEHPQAVDRAVTTTVDHSRAGVIKLASPAVRYGDGKMQVSRPPPVLGEHTDEVLSQELGMSQDEIHKLREGGAIGQ